MSGITTTSPKMPGGQVDMKKYIYDTLKSDSMLNQFISGRVYLRELQSIAKIREPFISIERDGEKTNDVGVRVLDIQIDIWGETDEQAENMMYRVIEIFNRKIEKGIASKLDFIGPDMSTKNGLARKILSFTFVTKDQKF